MDRPAVGVAPIAAVNDLHVSFRRGNATVRAIRGVSLELHRGEILGLVGESGSGKSVFGLSLLGLLPTTGSPRVSGSAVVCGVDMVTATEEQRRRLRTRHLGAIFQDPMTSLNPTMRVGRQLVESCGTAGEAVRLLDAVGVPEPKRRMMAFPHELSGGLRQRVMIAMAVAGSPELVVADEPTTALDVTVQAQVLELIRHLCNEIGTTFVLITHDLGVAAQVADRIAVLYGGRIAELGPASEVLGSPCHPYTEGLMRSRITMHTAPGVPLPSIGGEPPDPRAHPPGCPFAPRCDRHTDECDAALPDLADLVGKPGRASACIHLPRWSPAPGAAVNPATKPATPPEGDEFVVSMRGVSTSFSVRDGSQRRKQKLHALRGIDLQLRPRECVALVGESGCGKSTVLRILAGLQGIDAGSVSVTGNRPQMVFQDAGASLTPWLTVGELVGERLKHVGRERRSARVTEALRVVGLPAEIAAAKPNQLSGGQRQRVCLARAVVEPPEVLLCDEPTSALDVSLASTVLNLLADLRAEFGMAMLFVTHDLAAARIVADRIAVMYLGQIVEEGPAELVASDPIHPYTKALLSAVPELQGQRRRNLIGEPASPLTPPAGCAFHPRCTDAVEVCTANQPVVVSLGRVRRHTCGVHAEARAYVSP